MNFSAKVILSVMIIPLLSLSCSEIPGLGGEIIEEMEILESGYYSNYPEEGKVQKVIDSQAMLNAEWEKVYRGESPMPEVPGINFETHSVILLMLESKSTGGYSIDEVRVSEMESNLVAYYAEVQPGSDCMTTQAISRPYTILSVPNMDKEIRFKEKEPVVKNCN